MPSLHRQVLKLPVLLLSLSGLTACAPIYTWGYAPTIHPEATQAYILAVMARENHQYQEALDYYDTALRYTYSERVAKEREELKQCAMRNVQCN